MYTLRQDAAKDTFIVEHEVYRYKWITVADRIFNHTELDRMPGFAMTEYLENHSTAIRDFDTEQELIDYINELNLIALLEE